MQISSPMLRRLSRTRGLTAKQAQLALRSPNYLQGMPYSQHLKHRYRLALAVDPTLRFAQTHCGCFPFAAPLEWQDTKSHRPRCELPARCLAALRGPQLSECVWEVNVSSLS